MLNDWIPEGTIKFLEKQDFLIISKNGYSVKGYVRNKCLLDK